LSHRHTGVTHEVSSLTLDGGEPAVEDCPLREVLALIGDKWSTQVLVQLGDGPRRFTELERSIEGVSRRMLTLSLRGLERNGLITRTVYPEVPPRVEYACTPLTEQIREPLEALAAWAASSRTAIAAARRAYDQSSARATTISAR
jgi:DNA-binding HxlR family transcriptional regulator